MSACSAAIMTDAGEILLLRKQLLQARGRLARLRLRRSAGELREKLSAPKLAMSALASAPAGFALLGLSLATSPRSTLPPAIKFLARVLQIAGVTARFFARPRPAEQRTDFVRQRTDRTAIDA